jgi:hypothetical protein
MLLCERFQALFGRLAPGGAPTELRLNDVAAQLAVPRRRLYDIINVLEAVEIIAKRRSHDHRRVGMPADLGEHLNAIALGQTHVEHDKIGFEHAMMLDGDLAIRGAHSPIALPNEIGLEDLGDLRLVFDDQNQSVHGSASWRPPISCVCGECVESAWSTVRGAAPRASIFVNFASMPAPCA